LEGREKSDFAVFFAAKSLGEKSRRD